MTNPNSLDRWSRLARHVQGIRGGDLRKGVLAGIIWSGLPQHLSIRRTGFKAGLKAIADTRLSHEKARVIGISFDFLPQLADENSQVLDVISLVAAPDLLEQLVVRHH